MPDPIDLPLPNLPAQRATYLGIDPSLTATGVAVISKGRIQLQTIVPPKDFARGEARLYWFHHKFCELLATHRPAAVGIEGYAYGAKMKREALGELGGVLRLALYQGNREPHVIPPTNLKQFVANSADAAKEVVMREAFRRWGIEAADNNQADAAILAIMTMMLATPALATKLTAFQQKALSKL